MKKESMPSNEDAYNSDRLSPATIAELKEKYHIGHDGEYFQITGDDGRVHNIPSRIEAPSVNGAIEIEERIQQVLKEVRTQDQEEV